MGAGRVLTFEEWDQARRTSDVSALKLPAMPRFQSDVTRTPASGQTKGTALPAFDIGEPSTYLNPLLRQVVNPMLEHPVESAAVTLGPIAAAGVPVVGPPAAIAAGVGMAGMMAYHVAKYGWQKAHEMALSPEERQIAEANPERISGESAAIQALMLGLAPLIHVGVKAARGIDFGAGMVESGVEGVRSSDLGPGFRQSAIDNALDAGRTVDLQRAISGHADALRQESALRDAVTQQNAGRRTAIAENEAAITAEELRQEEVTRKAALRALTGVRRRPGGIPLTIEQQRAADAAALLDPPLEESRSFLESPQGAHVLGAVAAKHGMPETASPYAPESPLDVAWKEGHTSAAPRGAYPEGFSMGGAESRIPTDYQRPKLPRSEPSPTEYAPTGKTVPSVPIRDEKGALQRNLGRVATEDLHAEWQRLAELNNAEEALHAGAQEAGYRFDYNELSGSEKTGIKGKSGVDVSGIGDGLADPERIAADNKIIADYRKSTVAREARAKAMARIEAEIAKRPTAEEFNATATAYHAGEPGARPLTPIEGTGETRTRGLGASVERKAIANDLTDYLGDLPEYRQVNMADQAARSTQLLAENPVLARRVALGEEPPPKGLLPEAVFKVVEDKALAEGDVTTLRDLASGGLTTEATTMGQRIRALRDRAPDSPVTAMQSIEDARARGRDVAPEIQSAVADLKAHLDAAHAIDPSAWEFFIKSIRC
jgi:hypothetical protein